MANSELLSYVKQVMDLETAVYTNQRLQDGFSSNMAEQAPIHPRMLRCEEVVRPIQPIKPDGRPTHILLGHSIAGIIIFLVGLMSMDSEGIEFLFSIPLCGCGILFVILGVGFSTEKKGEIEKYTQDIEDYNRNLETYKKRSAEINEEKKKAEQTYQSEMAVYDEEMTVFTGECKKSRESIIEAGNHLKDALEQVYSVDVIFPKYRNLVAVTTIYEYLASGRCDTLEGADGAYNLYEMELRQNIIIGQLSSVLDSLEQIKNSQFTLYSELEESNRKSADLLSNISDNVEFSRYASEEIAKSNKALERNTEATKYYTLFNAAKRK